MVFKVCGCAHVGLRFVAPHTSELRFGLRFGGVPTSELRFGLKVWGGSTSMLKQRFPHQYRTFVIKTRSRLSKPSQGVGNTSKAPKTSPRLPGAIEALKIPSSLSKPVQGSLTLIPGHMRGSEIKFHLGFQSALGVAKSLYDALKPS